MYTTFHFKDDLSKANYLKLHETNVGGVKSKSEEEVILPHEVILVAVVEYTNKDPARVQSAWIVYSLFTKVFCLSAASVVLYSLRRQFRFSCIITFTSTAKRAQKTC